jgi:DNA transposition AAA+ family ATPase
VEVPPIGGPKALLLEIARAVGVNRNQSTPVLLQSIVRAFNGNRILLVDEAHRALPNDRRSIPTALETVRYIHDRTGAALALISTQRFRDSMEHGSYQYEQVVGRIGMPITLKPQIPDTDILPILTQFIPRPSAKLTAALLDIANKPGRLGMVVETLKVASRIANKARKTLAEPHVFDAIAMRTQMMGGKLGGAR